MFESRDKAYTRKFQRHVISFMEDSGLLRPDSGMVVAVSGGADSMALAHVLSELCSFGYSLGLMAVHVNHATRNGQKKEEELVRRYCENLGIEFKSSRLEGLDPNRNFEHEARKLRYQALRSFLRPNDFLVLGHHIDDSFEWSLLQNFRSSNLDGSLGIPVKNGEVIRPFMCVTKAQILRYARLCDLPFLDDPTNESMRHERNYIRKQIGLAFASKYPKYLKHYVHRQNELARRLGKHISRKQSGDFDNYYFKERVEIVSFASEFNPSGLEFNILQAMNYLVPRGRGSLSEQIKKVIQAARNGKGGPLTLAKGVKVYISHNHLMLCGPRFRPADSRLASTLEAPGNRQLFKRMDRKEYVSLLKRLYSEKNVGDSWPLWVEVESKNFNFEGAKSHSLWPELFARYRELKARNVRSSSLIPAIKLLRYWAKPKNKNKKLTLKLLLPL